MYIKVWTTSVQDRETEKMQKLLEPLHKHSFIFAPHETPGIKPN